MKHFIINTLLMAIVVMALSALVAYVLPTVSMWPVFGVLMVPVVAILGMFAYQNR